MKIVSFSDVSKYFPARTLDAGSVVAEDERLDKLVSDTILVALLDSLDGVVRLFALALDERVNGNLDSVPSLVTVHGVVAADKGDKLTNANLLGSVEELLDVDGGALRGSVTAITKGVDVHVLNAGLLGGAEEGEKMLDVRVDTTVRQQTHEVEATAVLLRVLEALDNERLLLEVVVLDSWAVRNTRFTGTYTGQCGQCPAKQHGRHRCSGV